MALWHLNREAEPEAALATLIKNDADVGADLIVFLEKDLGRELGRDNKSVLICVIRGYKCKQ